MSTQPPVETAVKEVVPKPKAKASLNPQDPNNSLHFIKLSNDEANNPIVNGPELPFEKSKLRRKDETQAEYNERVSPAEQGPLPAVEFTYLGAKRD